MRLKDKAALIVGVGPGMGQAMARLFAQEGARVALVARRTEHIQPLADALNARQPGTALAIQADATVRAQAEAVVAQAAQSFGRLDIVALLPGGGFRHVQDLARTEDEFFEGLLRNHLLTLLYATRAAIPHLQQAGGGAILTLAAGYKTRRDGNVAYGTVKDGVIGFTRNLARELHAANIRVNCLCPGLIRQPLPSGPIAVPQAGLARQGQPEDIAHAALFLASDEARWITGQTLVVDGGDEVLAGQPRAF